MSRRDVGRRGGLRQSGRANRRARTGRAEGTADERERRHRRPSPNRRRTTRIMDEEDRLRPDFVREVLDAAADGDDENARALVEPLHPADIADLIELAAADERDGLVAALAGMRRRRRARRDERARPRGPDRRSSSRSRSPTSPASSTPTTRSRCIEDLERGRAARGAARDGARRSRRDRGGADLSRGIGRPPDAARPDRGARALEGRPGDRLSPLDRRAGDRFLGSVRRLARPPSGRHLQAVVDPALAAIGRASPTSCCSEQTLIPVDMDQEEVALRFQKYALDLGRGGRRRRAGWSA